MLDSTYSKGNTTIYVRYMPVSPGVQPSYLSITLEFDGHFKHPHLFRFSCRIAEPAGRLCRHSGRQHSGTSINHHDCKNHSNVVSMDPGNLEMSRNTGGNAQAGHN